MSVSGSGREIDEMEAFLKLIASYSVRDLEIHEMNPVV